MAPRRKADFDSRSPSHVARSAPGHQYGEGPSAWSCKKCHDKNGRKVVNRATDKACRACKIHKGSSFGEKVCDGGAPTTSSREQRALVASQAKLDSMQAKLDQQAAELAQLRAKPVSPLQCTAKSDDQVEVVLDDAPEDPAFAKVKQLRNNIKAVSSLADSDDTTSLFHMPKSEKLLQLNRDLEAAQAALRESQPLAKQQSQIETHLRKLQKTLEADKAKLLSSEEILQAAQLERDTQLAAVAETQTRIDAAKKSAADIASRLAAELGAAPPPTSHLFQPGTAEWGALEELWRFVGNPDTLAALRAQGFPDDNLQKLCGCLDSVQAAGNEQLRQVQEASPGHRPPGTAEAVTQLVAESKLHCFETVAQLQRELCQYKSQLASVQQSWADMEADLVSDTESTAAVEDNDGFQVKAKRRRKKVGELGKVISTIGKH